MELVSVLMPCRNAAPWIGQALDSVLQQTHAQTEVIVVDDGSTDGSDRIARKFASPRCLVVRQEPRGASATRNHAFSLAQGAFIHYLDADDLLGPDKIARQVAALRGRGALALSWSSAVYLLDGRVDGRSRHEPARAAQPSGAEFLAKLWGADGVPSMMLVHQWLATRELIARAGPWNEALSVDDDGEFFARVVLTAEERTAVPEACCYYRKFRHRRNLSAAGPRRSAVKAACLKAGHLLSRTDNGQNRRAVARLLTQEIVDAYPDPAYRLGLDFLQALGLQLVREMAAPPWFQRAVPVLGWKATRRLQNWARAWRARHSMAF
jgi:glycosyltransferase involved in cell wall biosynthesis